MRFCLVITLIIINQIIAYANECADVLDCLRKKELSNIHLEQTQSSSYDKLMFNWQIEFLKEFDIKLTDADFFRNNEPTEVTLGSVFYYINKGDYYFHNYIDKKLEALEYYKIALEQSRTLKDKRLECEVLKKILWFHRVNYLYDNNTYKGYLDDYKVAAYDNFEQANYHYFNLILNFKNYYVDQWNNASHMWLLRYFETNEAPFLKALTYTVFASYYEEINDYKKVKNCIEIAEEAFSKIPFNYKKNSVNQLLMFAARIASKDRNLEQLQYYLSQFDTTVTHKSNFQYKALYFFYGSVYDTLTGNYKSAYNKFMRYDLVLDSFKRYKYNDLLNELETIYQTAEKEKQILEEQQKAQTSRNWLVVAIVALILGTGIAILVQKNTAKKRQLAEQEVLLKQQRVENLLKEQELASIDAMIAGQEKERQEVANELHDDLGGLMASIKLHFNSFKKEPDEKTNNLYSKTESLIDEAYQKIRAIAHAKNSGVIAKHGLLKSINEMAQKVSIANNLTINVNDHGLDDRLENTMELTLFRVIQELITNIVKHSNASEANIHLTKHPDYLNIMIEDNGDGFDTAGITTRSQGMGLKSVDKRISHLGGSMNIDSEIGRGTTIIIEVPT
ncbi:MAG: sensor histidine kinase [Fulvivirga sp.]|uniref:sensor histidine kinase n=1 Tax=Fulvivirga sp. TaxID=1931237 RepID=UPI0032FC6C2D